MAGIFEGLEKFGFKKKEIESVSVFEQPKIISKTTSTEVKTPTVADYVFQKPYECPICYKNFTSPTLKSGKVRLDHIDYDLRPVYENVEPLFYDVIMCNHCGYAAVSQKFVLLPDGITDIVHEFLRSNFVSIPTVESINIDSAIERYKLALLCATKRRAKDGERAYICLKLAWLYRIKGDRKSELTFIALMYKGFKNAYTTESMPICGLGPHTILFLMATASRTLGNKDESIRYLSSIITDRNASNNIKERSKDMRDDIMKRGN